MRSTLVAAVVAALAGCGGGGGGDLVPPPVASTATFPVRAAYAAAVDGGINLNLVGQDNDVATANRPGWNDWTGTISISSRAAPTGLPCASALKAVDVKLVLVRSRDNYRMQEAASFGYGRNYEPLCAVVLDGHSWVWNIGQPLPESSALKGNINGVESTGTISDYLGTGFAWPFTSIVGLDADTASSAYLAFVYHLTPTSFRPFGMFGENTEFRFRIDTTGKLLGVQYIRTGSLPAAYLDSVTLTMTSR